MTDEVSKADLRDQRKLYANIARTYLKNKKVNRYRMKKIKDMGDEEVIQKCHWWYEENLLVDEYKAFEKKMLAGSNFDF